MTLLLLLGGSMRGLSTGLVCHELAGGELKMRCLGNAFRVNFQSGWNDNQCSLANSGFMGVFPLYIPSFTTMQQPILVLHSNVPIPSCPTISLRNTIPLLFVLTLKTKNSTQPCIT